MAEYKFEVLKEKKKRPIGDWITIISLSNQILFWPLQKNKCTYKTKLKKNKKTLNHSL